MEKKRSVGIIISAVYIAIVVLISINACFADSIHDAVENNDLDKVKELLGQGVPLETKGEYNKTPLHIAAMKGYLEIVKYLVEQGADINAVDTADITPLHLAAYGGHLEIVKYLVTKGANVSALTRDAPYPEARMTPSDYAQIGEHTEIAEYLKSKEPAALQKINPFELSEQLSPITGNTYSELDKKTIFEKILCNQKNKKIFSIKASSYSTFAVEGEKGTLSALIKNFVDVDFEHNILRVRNYLKEGDYPRRSGSIPTRLYYISDEGFVWFDDGNNKWIKWPRFNSYVPTFWKAIELIRVGGFFDYKIKEAFNPSLSDMVHELLNAAGTLEPGFPRGFGVLFTGFSYTVLDVAEFNIHGIPCYQFNIRVSEDDLKRYALEDFSEVRKPPVFDIKIFAYKETELFWAIRSKLEMDVRGQWFTGDENFHIFRSDEFIYEYPESALELPSYVKNAEKSRY